MITAQLISVLAIAVALIGHDSDYELAQHDLVVLGTCDFTQRLKRHGEIAYIEPGLLSVRVTRVVRGKLAKVNVLIEVPFALRIGTCDYPGLSELSEELLFVLDRRKNGDSFMLAHPHGIQTGRMLRLFEALASSSRQERISRLAKLLVDKDSQVVLRAMRVASGGNWPFPFDMKDPETCGDSLGELVDKNILYELSDTIFKVHVTSESNECKRMAFIVWLWMTKPSSVEYLRWKLRDCKDDRVRAAICWHMLQLPKCDRKYITDECAKLSDEWVRERILRRMRPLW